MAIEWQRLSAVMRIGCAFSLMGVFGLIFCVWAIADRGLADPEVSGFLIATAVTAPLIIAAFGFAALWGRFPK